jgi:hypothetical protein
MSDEQNVDMLAGLSVVENELERALDELDDMYVRLNIHLLEWVSLWPLKWALGKLADDLHKVDTELRSARRDVTSARVDASEARAAQRSEQLQSLSVFNELRAELETVKAERDKAVTSANNWEEFANKRDRTLKATQQARDEALAERDSLKQQVAELTKNLGELPGYPQPECANCGSNMHREGTGWKCHTCMTEWSGGVIDFVRRNLAEPAPEPYQWQVGDEVECNGCTRQRVTDRDVNGWLEIEGVVTCLPQFEWERLGWKLFRKALPCLKPRHVPLDEEDLPDVPPMTPQQVAEFAEATEPIDDSTGADGEGQSQ